MLDTVVIGGWTIMSLDCGSGEVIYSRSAQTHQGKLGDNLGTLTFHDYY